MAAAAGIDPMVFLEERDPFRRRVMTEIAFEFRKNSDQKDQDRATLISNAIWKAVKKE